MLAAGEGGDPAIVSGESGAVTSGLVSAARLSEYIGMKDLFRLDKDSVVLCFSTEGNTDPDSYEMIVNGSGR